MTAVGASLGQRAGLDNNWTGDPPRKKSTRNPDLLPASFLVLSTCRGIDQRASLEYQGNMCIECTPELWLEHFDVSKSPRETGKSSYDAMERVAARTGNIPASLSMKAFQDHVCMLVQNQAKILL